MRPGAYPASMEHTARLGGGPQGGEGPADPAIETNGGLSWRVLAGWLAGMPVCSLTRGGHNGAMNNLEMAGVAPTTCRALGLSPGALPGLIGRDRKSVPEGRTWNQGANSRTRERGAPSRHLPGAAAHTAWNGGRHSAPLPLVDWLSGGLAAPYLSACSVI